MGVRKSGKTGTKEGWKRRKGQRREKKRKKKNGNSTATQCCKHPPWPETTTFLKADKQFNLQLTILSGAAHYCVNVSPEIYPQVNGIKFLGSQGQYLCDQKYLDVTKYTAKGFSSFYTSVSLLALANWRANWQLVGQAWGQRGSSIYILVGRGLIWAIVWGKIIPL